MRIGFYPVAVPAGGTHSAISHSGSMTSTGKKTVRRKATTMTRRSMHSNLITVWMTVFVVMVSSMTQSVHGYFQHNRSSYFNIQIPTHLHRNHSIEHIPARFGPHFNLRMEQGSLTLPVRVPDKKHITLCQTLTDPEIDAMKLHPPFILMVERGSCTFVHKVRQAQRIGAAGVLVADMKNEAHHGTFPKIMANDGSGQDIGIPSMLIDKKFGTEILNVLTKNNGTHPVVVEMAYHAPKFDYKVSLDLYHNPVAYHTVQFFKDWSVLEGVFQDENQKSMLNFRPHAMLLDGTKLGCVGESDKNESACFDLCTNNGRYCHVPSHNNMIAGKDVVGEVLRRECIHKHYDAKDEGSGATFWSYLSHFYKYCMDENNPSYFSNHECIGDAYTHSGIDEQVIKDCIKDSGGLEGDTTNADLDNTLKSQVDAGIIKSPTVMVNHDRAVLWDGLTAKNILYALCESYVSGQKPHVCYACMMCGDPMACAQRSPMHCEATDGQEKENPHKGQGKDDHHEDGGDSSGGKKKKAGHFFRWFFALVLIGGAAGGFMYYKKYMENQNDSMGAHSYSLQDAFLAESSG